MDSQSTFVGEAGLERFGVDGQTAVDGERRSPSGAASLPPGFKRRQHINSARVWLPALTGGLVVFAFGGQDVFQAIVLTAGILITAAALGGLAEPYKLMASSRLLLALAPPLVGLATAGAFALSDVYGLSHEGLVPGTLVAVAVALFVEYVGARLLAAEPLRVAVLGSHDFAAGLKRELDMSPPRRVEVVGWLDIDTAVKPRTLQLGSLDSIRSVLIDHRIDLLVRDPGLGGAKTDRRIYDTIAQECIDLPVRMIDGSQLYEQLFGHVPLGAIGSDWYLFLMHPRFQSTPPLQKRAFDIVGAAVVALLALPIAAIAALAIKLDDRGSVFYRQRRVGESGREFEILKLRTMSENAEAGGAQWSAAHDCRVTRVGRVLRRTHVDELPQIVNVLRGDMTLVGPRPERPEIIAELERLFPHYKRRLLVKPGVTGWAQVRCGYAGSTLGTAWKLCHDLYYLKHRNLLADALILLETVFIGARDSHREMRAPQPEFLYSTTLTADDFAPFSGEERGVQRPFGDAPEVAIPELVTGGAPAAGG